MFDKKQKEEVYLVGIVKVYFVSSVYNIYMCACARVGKVYKNAVFNQKLNFSKKLKNFQKMSKKRLTFF